jgi:hypothetical protein
MKSKLFIKIFFSLMFFEIVIVILSTVIHQMTDLKILGSIITILVTFCSLPLYLFDKTYPFYAIGTLGFQLGLMFFNLLIQTIILYFLILFYRNNFKKK